MCRDATSQHAVSPSTAQGAALFRSLSTRSVEDVRPQWDTNGRDDCGNTRRVVSLLHQIEAATEGRHTDGERENLAEDRDRPDRAIVFPTVRAVQLGHCDDAFGESREDVIEFR
jgi:hypothetical protein